MTAITHGFGSRSGVSAAGPAPAGINRPNVAAATHAPLLTVAAMARALGMRCDPQPNAHLGGVCGCGQPAVTTLVTDFGTVGCCAGGAR